jgi:hypothetical protein
MAYIFQAKQPFFGLVAGLLNQVFSKGDQTNLFWAIIMPSAMLIKSHSFSIN